MTNVFVFISLHCFAGFSVFVSDDVDSELWKEGLLS